MTEEQIYAAINSSTADDTLKELMRLYVGLALSAGFTKGMKAASEIQNIVLDSMGVRLKGAR